jgi:hypothetical protein
MNYRTAGRNPFFLYLTMVFLPIAIAGFSTTFFLPLARGTFSAPPIIHVHGALLFGWLIFLIAQASLIQTRNALIHRRVGWAGAALCAAIVVSGILVGAFATRRDLAAGGDDWLLGSFVNTVLEMILFGSLVGAAIINRKKPEIHKRLLVVATISILGPAWLRFRHFMPFVPDPFVTFSFIADSVLLLPIAHDWISYRKVHPVYIWIGGGVVVIHAVELLVMESDLWLQLGRWLLGMPAV